jgi:hypothetical protein
VRAFFMVSQAFMPKRCNVLLEAVKELPPFGRMKMKGHGLCHDQRVWVPILGTLALRRATFVQKPARNIAG